MCAGFSVAVHDGCVHAAGCSASETRQGTLALLSVVAFTVILFKAGQFLHRGIGRAGGVESALNDWLVGNRTAAMSSLAKRRNPTAHVVRHATDGIARVIKETTTREDADRVALDQVATLRSYLRVLESTSQLAPLPGLFGTVIGMVSAFKGCRHRAPKPTQLNNVRSLPDTSYAAEYSQLRWATSHAQPDTANRCRVSDLDIFVVAGTLRPVSARDIMRATITPDAADAVSPGLLVIHADGRKAYRGATLRLDNTTATLANEAPAFKNKTFTVVADARLPGHTLLEVMRALRSAGFSSISLLTERRRK